MIAERLPMLDLHIERIGELAVVRCNGRIVRNGAALQLRHVVTSLEDSRIIVLDLSGVSAIGGGGLGILLFLQRWACVHKIQFKVLDPTRSVRERLEHASSMAEFEIRALRDMTALLADENS
jgi:anti-anti-sigma regulatory factor